MKTTTIRLPVIKSKSRWDVFNMDIESLPDEQFAVSGEDGRWFLTTKNEMKLHKQMADQFKQMEDQLIYGKYAKEIRNI
jgi:hypothetical protein